MFICKDEPSFDIYERPSHSDVALMANGIGDICSIFSWLDRYPKKVLYAGPADRTGVIGTLVRQLGIDFEIIGKDRVYYSKPEIEAVVGALDGVEDMTIRNFFPQCLAGHRQYVGAPWLKMNLPRPCDEEYIVCTPASTNHGINRNLTCGEMNAIFRDAKSKVAIIFKGSYPVPGSAKLLPTMNKTNILESIAWLKHASGYAGVDSWSSIIASQCGYPCLIKSVNEHYYRFRAVYSAPAGSHIKVVSQIS